MNIVIIGATSGIGKALFEKYANGENKIGIIGRRAYLLEELHQKYPSKTISEKADITNLEEIKKVINSLHDVLCHIDLAIVCSGIGDINATLDYDVECPIIDTNVVGWTFCINTLYHIFEQQDNGHLVAITSAGGLRGEPMAPAYSATKSYQINYMEALRKKAFKNGGHIIITDIRPGLVDTAMAKGEGLFWVMPVEKVARQIVMAIRKRKSVVYVTKRWYFIAIINRFIPYCLYKRI